MTTVAVKINLKKAIEAGSNDEGVKLIHLDVSTLSSALRAELARCPLHEGYPVIDNMAQASVEAITQELARRAERTAAEHDRVAADTAKQIDYVLRLEPQDLLWIPAEIHRAVEVRDPATLTSATSAYYADPDKVRQDERVQSLVKRAQALADELNVKRSKKWEEQEEQVRRQRREEERRQEEAILRRKEQLAAWVRQFGTNMQQERFTRGLLPEDEIVDTIRDQVFAPLDHLPHYEKITKQDVINSYADLGYGPNSKVIFRVEAASSASDEQMARMLEIERLVPGATTELRLHEGVLENSSGDEDEEYAVRCHSILVTVQVGELTLSREYAA